MPSAAAQARIGMNSLRIQPLHVPRLLTSAAGVQEARERSAAIVVQLEER